MPPRTIDNLGVDVSTRYAEDQKILDKTFIKESRGISIDTEIEVTTPSFSAEIEALLQTQPTNVTWATFTPPAFYFEQRKRLFTFQMIPSMGSEDKQESQGQKILAKLQSIVEKPVEKKEDKQSDQRQKYQEERALEEETREKKVLSSLLKTVTTFDKLIIEINSRRSQYQKG